jgi:hypothetical protein
MMTRDQSLLAEFTNITPHGLRGTSSRLRQFINIHITALANQHKQLIVPRVTGQFGKTHEISSKTIALAFYTKSDRKDRV